MERATVLPFEHSIPFASALDEIEAVAQSGSSALGRGVVLCVVLADGALETVYIPAREWRRDTLLADALLREHIDTYDLATSYLLLVSYDERPAARAIAHHRRYRACLTPAA